MTLSEFLDAAYAILVEEARKASASLLDAFESVQEWRAGGPPPALEEVPTARGRSESAPRYSRPKTEAEIVEQNNQALAWLRTQMPGLGV